MRKWSFYVLRNELRAYSYLCGLVVIVGVNEREVISKGTGGCPVSSFATLVETQKKRYLEHDNFISHINIASPSYSVIISTHKAQFVTFYSLPWTITYQIIWSF